LNIIYNSAADSMEFILHKIIDIKLELDHESKSSKKIIKV